MGRRREEEPNGDRRMPGALAGIHSDRRLGFRPAEHPDGAFRPRDWLIAAALVLAVFLVYQPVWQAGFTGTTTSTC